VKGRAKILPFGRPQYFERDGAYFRRQSRDSPSIDDVWDFGKKKWTPFDGDRQKIYQFGYPIPKSDLPVAAGGTAIDWVAPIPTPVEPVKSHLIDLTKQDEGRAFQIIGAPHKKPLDVIE
jgi:hypothetical protein